MSSYSSGALNTTAGQLKCKEKASSAENASFKITEKFCQTTQIFGSGSILFNVFETIYPK